VEIKERVYTLGKYRPDSVGEQLYLKLNGENFYCPFQVSANCSEWCPAFKTIPGRTVVGNTIARVELNCFPQPVSFDIQEAPND